MSDSDVWFWGWVTFLGISLFLEEKIIVNIQIIRKKF